MKRLVLAILLALAPTAAGAMWPDFSQAATSAAAPAPRHRVHVAQAGAAVPTPQPRPTAAPAAAQPGKLTVAQVNQDPLTLLRQFSVNDLNNAIALAQANNDQTSLPCWQKLLSIVQTLNGASPTGSSSSPTGNALQPGIATALQDARDAQQLIANLQSSNGPLAQLNMACAPLVVSTQNTLIQLGLLTGAIVGAAPTGGLSLLPGIALPALALPKL